MTISVYVEVDSNAGSSVYRISVFGQEYHSPLTMYWFRVFCDKCSNNSDKDTDEKTCYDYNEELDNPNYNLTFGNRNVNHVTYL